jgi:uncharacterized protein (TIGR03066 family)
MATAAADGFVRVWDVETLECLLTLRSPGLGVRQLVFSEDNLRLIALTDDLRYRVWTASPTPDAEQGGAKATEVDKIGDVYKAMTLGDGVVLGKSPFKVGDTVDIQFDVMNSSLKAIRPPMEQLGEGRTECTLGYYQFWFERLGDFPTISGFQGARRGNQYAYGGSNFSDGKIVASGRAIRIGRSVSTRALPVGRYRLTCEYRARDSAVLQSKAVEFELGPTERSVLGPDIPAAKGKLDPSKLLGKWSENTPAGIPVIIEFKSSGKVTYSYLNGRPDPIGDGTYKLVGNKLTITVNSGKGSGISTSTYIVELRSTEILAEDSEGRKLALKRAK